MRPVLARWSLSWSWSATSEAGPSPPYKLKAFASSSIPWEGLPWPRQRPGHRGRKTKGKSGLSWKKKGKSGLSWTLGRGLCLNEKWGQWLLRPKKHCTEVGASAGSSPRERDGGGWAGPACCGLPAVQETSGRRHLRGGAHTNAPALHAYSHKAQTHKYNPNTLNLDPGTAVLP